ncbi:MAG: chorismate synthase [Clostridiales bacterium]|nr:chorismate synthase [Candidatus Cacconaster stercorequi]
MMDYTLFGESHGPVVGILLRHVPAGLTVDEAFIARQMERRMARGALATARHEVDRVEFLSGVFEGKTTGMPLVAIIRNGDVRAKDYDALRAVARPGHADYTAYVKSGGGNDYRGGGHFSGRLTAPLTAAGALALTWLKEQKITVEAQIVDEDDLRRRAAEAKADGDSVGGQIRCTIMGLPAGVGGPDWYDAVESEMARHLFAIPGVKAVSFGAGENFASLRGSEANDAFRTDGKCVWTVTNHSGGINGGITNGMPVVCTVTFRPTPSIAKAQDTVDFRAMENTTVSVAGRHDPCIVLRAAPVVEAAAALALCQLMEPEAETLDDLRRRIDDTDEELVELLARRMELSRRVGDYKKANGLPVLDARREEQVLQSRGDLAPEYRQAVEAIYREIMRWSREEQQ